MMSLAALLPHIDTAGITFQLPEPALSREEELEIARSEAAAVARMQAEADAEARLAEMAARHAEEMHRTRAAWCEEEGARLAASILQDKERIERDIANTAADLLQPFVESLIPRQAVAELVARVAEAAGNDFARELTVSGPEDLVDRIATALAGKGFVNVGTVVANRPEAQVVDGDSSMTTAIGRWIDALREIGHG